MGATNAAALRKAIDDVASSFPQSSLNLEAHDAYADLDLYANDIFGIIESMLVGDRSFAHELRESPGLRARLNTIMQSGDSSDTKDVAVYLTFLDAVERLAADARAHFALPIETMHSD